MINFGKSISTIFAIVSINDCIAQTVSNGLNFYKEDTLSVFYEGRRDLSFDFVIENTTLHRLNIESAFDLVSLYEIRDSANKVIYIASKDSENEYSQFVFFEEHKLEWPHTHFEPNEKIFAREAVTADLTPNFVSLSQYLDKTSKKENTPEIYCLAIWFL